MYIYIKLDSFKYINYIYYRDFRYCFQNTWDKLDLLEKREI